MRAYIDHILALLPFEPEVHRRLGGPPCTYVGHPLTDEVSRLRPSGEDMRRRLAAPPILLVLPGSRIAEIERLLAIFGRTVELVAKRFYGRPTLLNPEISGHTAIPNCAITALHRAA